MIDTTTDLILWQWPVRVIITVAFYAFALKGLESLVRNAVSFSVRLKRFMKNSEAVDYSERRPLRRGSGENSQDVWQMITWWITQCGQRQREPLEVRILDMPAESRAGGVLQYMHQPASDFGPETSPGPDESH